MEMDFPVPRLVYDSENSSDDSNDTGTGDSPSETTAVPLAKLVRVIEANTRLVAQMSLLMRSMMKRF